MDTPEFLVAAAASAFAIAVLHVLCVREDRYFVWLLPTFLVALPVAMLASRGVPAAGGALVGVAASAGLLCHRSLSLFREHQAKLQALARELGLNFARNDQTFAEAAVWLADDVGSCFNVLSGKWHETTAAVFQYGYLDTSDGEAPAFIQLTCAASTLDAELPRMLVREPRLRDRFGMSLHGRIATADAFDRAFRIEAPDPERAKAALPSRTRAWLVTHAQGERLAISGHTIVLTAGRARTERLTQLLDRIVELRATFN